MKILLAAVSFSSKMSGVQRHAFNLVRCLLSRSEITELHLAVGPWQLEMLECLDVPADARLNIHVAAVGASSLSRNRWHYTVLQRLTDKLQPDIVHLSYPVPINASTLRCPLVLTLHDLYPYEIPSNFKFPHVLVNRVILRYALDRADAIAAVSDATLFKLKQHAPEHVCRNAVRIYNCVEKSVRPGVLERACQRPFLLCVAQHRKNKNIPLLIRVLRILLDSGAVDPAIKLVVVGIPGPETARIQRLVERLRLDDRVLFIDGLSDTALQWCYTHCEALVVPSITEGFGLPVAEALLAGCRIICSDIPALREIGKEHCRYFNLGNDQEQELANAIARTVCLPKPDPVALPFLSGEVLAREYINLYRRVTEKYYEKAGSKFRHKELRNGSAVREV